jgi:YegS/Rv2252/BmrU family lipid kinase
LICIIVNPISGGRRGGDARSRVTRASAALTAAGEPGEVLLTEGRGHARALAANAIRQGARLVIAWGGDGTINEVGSVLAGQTIPIGIVPAGSGNGLASELGIARQPERALAEAFRAAPRPIDAGEINGRRFFTAAGVGFDAHIAACFDRSGGRRGFASYLRISARELLTYRSATYRIDDAESARRALIIVFANAGQYGNGARIAPAARLDDGRLDMVVFEERSRLATCWAIPRLFAGAVSSVRGFSSTAIERAVVTADAPMTFHADGEPVDGGTRLEVRVLPGALRVCVR